jgi:hypothetical protein
MSNEALLWHQGGLVDQRRTSLKVGADDLGSRHVREEFLLGRQAVRIMYRSAVQFKFRRLWDFMWSFRGRSKTT